MTKKHDDPTTNKVSDEDLAAADAAINDAETRYRNRTAPQTETGTGITPRIASGMQPPISASYVVMSRYSGEPIAVRSSREEADRFIANEQDRVTASSPTAQVSLFVVEVTS